MLDLNFVRENLDRVRAALEARNASTNALDVFTALDNQRRQAISQSDSFNAELNRASKEIGALMKAGKSEDAMVRRSEVALLKEQIADASNNRDNAEKKMRDLLETLPNLPHE